LRQLKPINVLGEQLKLTIKAGEVGFSLLFARLPNLYLLHGDLALLKANLIVSQLNLALGDEIGQSAKADRYLR
jgi:hypothetical protein